VFQCSSLNSVTRYTESIQQVKLVNSKPSVIRACFSASCKQYLIKQETQLSLTNRRDAFIGQSRSPNIVPFHILGIGSYCAIVTVSFRRALFTIFDFKICRDLEIGVRGHSVSLNVATFDRLCMVSY